MNETTVLSFYPALEAGYEPRDYAYAKEAVPTGEYRARLDFMIWSKKQVAINCFFTLLPSGQQVSLSAYRDKDEKYTAGQTEMRYVPFGTVMQLMIDRNGQGYPKLTNAVVVAEDKAQECTEA